MGKFESNGSQGKGPAPVGQLWKNLFTDARKGGLTWADAGPEDLLAAVVAATEQGAAVLLAKTSDGGALMVQVIVDAAMKPKFYAASMAELNAVLEAMATVR